MNTLLVFKICYIALNIKAMEARNTKLLPTLPKCDTSDKILYSQITIPGKLTSSKDNTMYWFIEHKLTCEYTSYNISYNHTKSDVEEEVEDPIAVFDTSGVLILGGGNYMKTEYCVQRITENEYVINVCDVSCDDPNGRICVPKCCGWNKVIHNYGEGNVTCADLKEPDSKPYWRPAVYHKEKGVDCLEANDRTKDCIHYDLDPDIFHYQNIFGGCEDEENYTLDVILFEEIPFGFTRTGSLLIHTFEIERHSFCIDSATSAKATSVEPHVALVCVPMCPHDPYANEKQTIGTFYIATMFTSAFFLMLTIVVYMIIWEKHNIHGWTVFSLAISMGLMLILLGSARLMSALGRQELSRTFKCILVGVLAHYFFLTTFCLLTCLSFDLWWTFRSLAPSFGKSKGLLRFRMYLVFSLGLPLVIVIIGIIMDRVYDNPNVVRHKSSRIIIPQYGVDTCYIDNKYSQGVYIFLPVAILLLANLGFFLATMYIMYEYHKNTQAARKNSAKQKQTFQLFAKLFFVMGVTWTVEVIEYIAKYNRQDYDSKNCQIHHPPGKAWIFTDILNICQGIAIFLIFVCKKQVMIQLSRKHSSLRGKFGPSNSVSQRVALEHGVSRSGTLTITASTLNRSDIKTEHSKMQTESSLVNQMDLDAPSGKTNQSSISMRTYSSRRQEISSVSD